MASISDSNKRHGLPSAGAPKLPPSQLTGRASCLVALGNGKILAADSQFDNLFSEMPNHCLGHSVFDLFPEIIAEMPRTGGLSAISAPITLATIVNCAESPPLQAIVTVTPLLGFQENYLLVTVGTGESTVEILPQCDALTGLPNRRELFVHRSRWQKISTGACHPHALLFLDLDNFKQVNDNHGHAAGDQLLSTLATRWQSCIRENDLLARYGGDEFVVLLAGIQQRSELTPVIERLVAATNMPIVVGDQSFLVGVTIGIALAKDISDDLGQLIAKADRDMYRQKNRPVNTINKPR